MRKCAVTAFALSAGLTVLAAEEPDGLRLPAGFHATVVAENLGPIRHLTVRDNGDVYVSTPKDQQGNGKGTGIIALRLDASHKAVDIQHFGTIDGGTGIGFHNGALYATSPSGISRFTFSGNALVPAQDPDVIVDGTPTTHPGFNRANRPIAFDTSGHVFLSLEATGNFCAEPTKPNTPPVGLKPCPDLRTRAGIWRFSADKTAQKFPSDGEAWATGIRDLSALAWSPADGHLYGIMHGRDTLSRNWPALVPSDAVVADEMHRVTKGTDFGWPYTFFDGARNLRLVSPEYGGDGKTVAAGNYSAPVLTFHSGRAAPVDLLFYGGTSFPASYRNGAFIVLHGTGNKTGYNVVFVPLDKNGKAGEPTAFADGFAAFDQSTPPKSAAVLAAELSKLLSKSAREAISAGVCFCLLPLADFASVMSLGMSLEVADSEDDFPKTLPEALERGFQERPAVWSSRVQFASEAACVFPLCPAYPLLGGCLHKTGSVVPPSDSLSVIT